jgi:hypothetical protein
VPGVARLHLTVQALLISWVHPRLAPGEKATFSFQAKCDRTGAYSINVAAVADGLAPDEYAASVRVVDLSLPDVTISVTRDVRVLGVGDDADFVIKVANAGNQAAMKLGLKAELSPGIEPLESAGSKDHALYKVESHRVVFPLIERLEPGQTAERTIRCRAKVPGEAVCRAFVQSDESPQALDAMAACRVEAPRR